MTWPTWSAWAAPGAVHHADPGSAGAPPDAQRDVTRSPATGVTPTVIFGEMRSPLEFVVSDDSS